ncbi:MAG: hypothetical protein IJ697_06610 [Synergistaceae bacterium]|nr:hypothetical protein [Synergistaceae bacterium]
MSSYSGIKEVKVLSNTDKVNTLLDDWWELLEFYKGEYGILFVLGRSFVESSFAEFEDDYPYEGTE